ncbi:lysine histidine transporter-like 8 [Prunus yedoensis var. nudiflora]|uniref:Lysine histidine transporter-like 8 n=1 Tax=Prunus yedoensis var. nudiflora TaxID=2094558 RepID=A0A314YNW1_PRUYE|nr:lysine histidine transporter-like 8 [Prunus yedoensis var. nudiflora]
MADMEEVVVEANCRPEETRATHPFRSSPNHYGQVIPITTSLPPRREEDGADWGCGELNPQDAWLPITESRNGNHSLFSSLSVQELEFKPFYCLLHLPHLDAGVVDAHGVYAPKTYLTSLIRNKTETKAKEKKKKRLLEGTRAWGIICLSLAFTWQLYTTWLLVHLHESESGIRYSRYLHLAVRAFGLKLGKLLTIFPVMYQSGGTCVQLIIIGGGIMELFFKNVCDVKSLTGTECFLVFMCMAIVVAQFPNLNSIAWVSFIGAITAVGYCTLIWALSIGKGRPSDISYNPPEVDSNMDRFGGIMNSIGIIFITFRGHNVMLEIQGTLPSSSKHPSHKQMWRGVTISYALIAMCLLPLAIAGFWVYGNKIPSSMVVFDNLEFKYTSRKSKPCSQWLRMVFRFLFGGVAFFAAVALPFLPRLAPLIGGMTLPLAYAYPCFMWIAIKKPQPRSGKWCINMGLGCLGLVLSVVLVVAAIWNLTDKGLNANFFKPE